MEHHFPKANSEVLTRDRPFVSEIPKYRKLVASLNLTGLANDTKWNELLTAIRNTESKEWRPSFRFKTIDSDVISGWDCEWWHHLPFPFITVSWFEISYHEEVYRGSLLDKGIVNHSDEIEKVLTVIGFDYEKGSEAFRIFGYAPRDYQGFVK